MGADINYYPLQMDQVGCKILTWIYLSRTRKGLQDTENLYLQFRQEALNITRGGQELHLI